MRALAPEGASWPIPAGRKRGPSPGSGRPGVTAGLARRGNLRSWSVRRLALAGRARGHQFRVHFLGRPVHRLGQALLLVLRALPRDLRPRVLQVPVLDLRVRLLAQVREERLRVLQPAVAGRQVPAPVPLAPARRGGSSLVPPLSLSTASHRESWTGMKPSPRCQLPPRPCLAPGGPRCRAGQAARSRGLLVPGSRLEGRAGQRRAVAGGERGGSGCGRCGSASAARGEPLPGPGRVR